MPWYSYFADGEREPCNECVYKRNENKYECVVYVYDEPIDDEQINDKPIKDESTNGKPKWSFFASFLNTILMRKTHKPDAINTTLKVQENSWTSQL